MEIIKWHELDEIKRDRVLTRAAIESNHVAESVNKIIEKVRRGGDAALREFSSKFDGYYGPLACVLPEKRKAAVESLKPDLRGALQESIAAITAFHRAQLPKGVRVETRPGVVCERIWRPIERVGLYVPGGTAPYFSAVLMLAIPARLAGCRTCFLCTPPGKDGSINPVILAAADMCGIDRVWPIGGAQAIAAMAFGTETVPKVDKIFGPGNAYVTEAKQQVAQAPGGAAVDMPAGPSEVMVIADASANPAWVAADLLAQAEHGPDSQAFCVTTDERMAAAVQKEIARQMTSLSRQECLQGSMRDSFLLVVDDLEEALLVANRYAPEHLILQIENASRIVGRIYNAGSVFIGPWSPETAGDYASGTNHVLPTYGYARAYSGLGVPSFMKSMSVQSLTREGLGSLAPALVTLAKAEGFDGHAAAVSIRLGAL